MKRKNQIKWAAQHKTSITLTNPNGYWKNGNWYPANKGLEEKCKRYCVACLKTQLNYSYRDKRENKICETCKVVTKG